MQTDISGQHLKITESLQDYVNSKLERLDRHLDTVASAHVVLSVENKIRQRAEATITFSGANIFADAENENMYAAIDAMVDKLDGQIRKHKGKNNNHHRKNGALKDQNFEIIPEDGQQPEGM